MPDRIEEWKAPTGRWLRPGGTFRVEGERGAWRFIAYVDNGSFPYVEAVAPRSGNIRCFRPERVHSVAVKS